MSFYDEDRLPTFCMVVFIIDLLLCILRAGLVAVAMFTLGSIPADDPLALSGRFEIITGCGIALFGIFGNALMLAKQRWAYWLGYLNIAATIGSFFVGIWQATIMIQRFQPGTAQYIGGFIGAAVAVLFRIGVAVLFGIALAKFRRWAEADEYYDEEDEEDVFVGTTPEFKETDNPYQYGGQDEDDF